MDPVAQTVSLCQTVRKLTVYATSLSHASAISLGRGRLIVSSDPPMSQRQAFSPAKAPQAQASQPSTHS